MRFALLAFTTRMVSGYNRGGVTIHAPLGDGNYNCSKLNILDMRYNPRPVRGRKHIRYNQILDEFSYNPRPVRGRKLALHSSTRLHM